MGDSSLSQRREDMIALFERTGEAIQTKFENIVALIIVKWGGPQLLKELLSLDFLLRGTKSQHR